MYLKPRQIVRLVIVIAAILLAPRYLQAASGCDGNGNCYIYASATGSGNGSSWTNAYTGFGSGSGKVNPGSMTRGVTYWIANGNYGAVTFQYGHKRDERHHHRGSNGLKPWASKRLEQFIRRTGFVRGKRGRHKLLDLQRPDARRGLAVGLHD